MTQLHASAIDWPLLDVLLFVLFGHGDVLTARLEFVLAQLESIEQRLETDSNASTHISENFFADNEIQVQIRWIVVDDVFE